jgi:hypothetical protein
MIIIMGNRYIPSRFSIVLYWQWHICDAVKQDTSWLCRPQEGRCTTSTKPPINCELLSGHKNFLKQKPYNNKKHHLINTKRTRKEPCIRRISDKHNVTPLCPLCPSILAASLLLRYTIVFNDRLEPLFRRYATTVRLMHETIDFVLTRPRQCSKK